MDENEFLIELQAKLDEAKSKENINKTDIPRLQAQLDKLKLQAEINPNTISNLVKQLESVLNQKINISNIGINPSQISKSAQQTGQQIGKNITQGINSAIQKSGKFKSEYLFDGTKPQNKVTETVLKDFRELSDGIVTVREQMKNVDGKSFLDGFTVNIEHASGQVETLTYRLKDMMDAAGNVTGKSFQYSSGSINDNGVIKQMNAISTKADDLQIKLDKLKANYSDVNASRPIKASSNISALSQQYDKVSQAIENVRNADSSTFTSMTSNAQKEISILESMISQFRNAENVATQMKSTDISSGIAQASERLGKLKANSNGFEQMAQTVRDLEITLSQVGDKASLDKFINDLRVAETQLGRVKAEAKQFAEANKIQFSIDNGTYDAKYDDLVKKTQQWSVQTENVKKSLVELEAAYKGLRSDSTDEEKIAAAKRWEQAVKSVNNAVKKTKLEYATDSQISSFHQKLQEFYDKNTATHGRWGKDLKQMLSDTDNGAKVTNKDFEKMKSNLDDISNKAREAGKLGKSFFDTVKSNVQSYLPWVSMAGVISEAIQQSRKMYDAVYDIDTAMTELAKVSDATAYRLMKSLEKSTETAKKYGSTINDIVNATADWSRLGYDMDSAEKLAEVATIYKNVGDGIDIDTANKSLVSTLQGFQLKADEALSIIDKFNEVNSLPPNTVMY